MTSVETNEGARTERLSPAQSKLPSKLPKVSKVSVWSVWSAWSTWWRIASRVGVVTLGLLIGLDAGIGAVLAVASVSDAPALFFSAGLAAFALVAAGMGALATRGLTRHHQRNARLGIAGAASLVALVATLALLVPLHDPSHAPTAVRGQQFWDLPTGSRIAYVKISAVGTPKPTPIIFVHGGPGVAMMAVDAKFFGQLARDGYDVYVYDQIGAGLSPRLADPTQYTVSRQVADLEAIRQRIGAERVILIGHSWGGTVAAAYLADHPESVEKVVFSSPGAMDWAEMGSSGTGMLGRLTPEQRWQTIQWLLPPRALLSYALVQVNPHAARAYAGDRELDARYDRLYALSAPGMFCDPYASSGEAVHGLGFYANAVPQSARAAAPPDPRAVLRVVRTPALVLKGSCDYLPWAMTREYRDTLPHAQLVYLSGAGHQAYQEQPALYLATVRAFLQGSPLPVQPYTGQEPPSDYTGVR